MRWAKQIGPPDGAIFGRPRAGVVHAAATAAILVFSALEAAGAENDPHPASIEPALKFERITIDQGLSQNSVLSIDEDSHGFVWLGTMDGLHRLDGHEFTVFAHDPSDPTSLSNSYVNAILTDRRGTLWIGTNAGLNRLDPTTGGFARYLHDPEDPGSLGGDMVHAVFEDHLGILWVGTDEGLNRFDRDSGEFARYVPDPRDARGLGKGRVLAIVEDLLGNLWIGTGDGLYRRDRKHGTFVEYRHDRNDPHSLSNNDVRALYRDRSGALWIGTVGGLNRWVPEAGRFQRFLPDASDPHSLGETLVLSVFEDSSGTVWVGTNGGLHRFDRETEGFAPYRHDPNDPGSLSDDQIVSIYEDRSGILWFGTWNGGVNKLVHRREQFRHLFHNPGVPESLSSNVVKAIDEDGHGMLWVATANGLNRWDSSTGRFTHYRRDPEDPTSLSHDDVWTVYRDGEGTMWIGTGAGLDRFDAESESFVRHAPYADEPANVSYNAVAAVYDDRAGSLWVGTIAGLTRFDRRRGRFTDRFTHDPGDPRSLSDNIVSVIHEDWTGRLWVGTNQGLNRLDPVTGQFTRYLHDRAEPRSLSANVITSIHESHHEDRPALWIGTQDGLNRYDPVSDDFKRYTERDGLPNDFICGILEDGEGRLWLSTNRGLSRFDPVKQTVRNYDVHDGLQSNEFNMKAYHRARDGEMYFGGPNGFSAFHPDRLVDNPYVPPVVLTDFRIFNRSVTPSGAGSPLETVIFQAKDVVLSYKENVFSFEFAALDYTAPQKNRYAYKMEGFDPDWNYVGNRRFATYTNLDPGEYVFRVKGSNNDGVWNEEGAQLTVTITPPPWKTWWAYSFYVIVTLGALYGIRRYELNRMKLKNRLKWEHLESEKLRELDSMKSKFFANVSHEFRTPLSLILGPVEQLREEATDDKTRDRLGLVQRNARGLERLVDQLLDLSRLESGRMRLRVASGDIAAFTRTITMFFAPLAEQKGIRLSFAASPEALSAYFDGDKVEKIFTNLLGNALKFTGAGGAIEVNVEPDAFDLRRGRGGSQREEDAGRAGSTSFVEIRVSDTGTGIPADHLRHVFDRFYQVDDSLTREGEGAGIGLALAKELVELHHGTIDVASEEGRGTTFVVRLPLGKEVFTSNEILSPASRTEAVGHDRRPELAEAAALSEERRARGCPGGGGRDHRADRRRPCRGARLSS